MVSPLIAPIVVTEQFKMSFDQISDMLGLTGRPCGEIDAREIHNMKLSQSEPTGDFFYVQAS
jgi:hypothetical protein